ncbi:MAG: hypothetical protein QHH19_03865 [Candidatus Thermoplasmatota archaeon]|jgi:hypothetical protein|nr:hypothetical protein [Candidatus Thermoplasmatota archaeon]
MKKMKHKKHAGVSTVFIFVAVFMLSLASAAGIMNTRDINEENNLNIYGYSIGQSRSLPTIVEFYGPSSIDIGETATFYVKAIDPNGLYIKYLFDWKIYPGQDFNVDYETPLKGSNQVIAINHTFCIGGTYDVAVIAENENGERSEIAVHDFSVNGGYTDIRYVKMWIEPDKFIPGQSVNFNSTIKNFGNRDYLETTHQPYVYFDGKRIGSVIILHPRLLEADETASGGFIENYLWPNDYNEHEIKFYYLEVTGFLYKSAVENEPPLKPSVKGPSKATSGKVYPCSSSTTDPNEHKIYYLFDFGDGVLSGWLGPYESGKLAETSHKWYKGTYELRAKAKDEHGLESEWSDPFTVIVTKGKSVNVVMNQIESYRNTQQSQNNLLLRALSLYLNIKLPSND